MECEEGDLYMAGFKTKVTPEIENLTEVCKEHTSLDLSLYANMM